MDGPRSHGFSLPELLCTLAVAAGVAAWAMPSFQAIALDAARTREVNGFLQAVHLARAEAIKRNGVVSLCPSPDGGQCAAGAAWQAGWIVFVYGDRDSPAARDEGEDLVRAYPAWDGGQIGSNRPTLSFRPYGQSGVTATVTFCDRRGSEAARAVVISQTGRPRVSARAASGGPLPCP